MIKAYVSGLVTLVIYSFPFLLALGGTAFVFDTGDFSAWGMEGRGGALGAGAFASVIWVLIWEIEGARKKLIERIWGDIGGDAS